MLLHPLSRVIYLAVLLPELEKLDLLDSIVATKQRNVYLMSPGSNRDYSQTGRERTSFPYA